MERLGEMCVLYTIKFLTCASSEPVEVVILMRMQFHGKTIERKAVLSSSMLSAEATIRMFTTSGLSTAWFKLSGRGNAQLRKEKYCDSVCCFTDIIPFFLSQSRRRCSPPPSKSTPRIKARQRGGRYKYEGRHAEGQPLLRGKSPFELAPQLLLQDLEIGLPVHAMKIVSICMCKNNKVGMLVFERNSSDGRVAFRFLPLGVGYEYINP
jgi:hypothetical protein